MKTKIFLDFDGTLVDSIKAYCSTYNTIYKQFTGFKEAVWYNVNRYDLKDECPIVKNPREIFQYKIFFKFLEFMNGNTFDILRELDKHFDIHICSIGTPENLSLKCKWLQENLFFVEKYILISNGTNKMDKSIVDMSDSIIIDDHVDNLISSNAAIKICFGEEYDWNKNWDGIRCVNWSDLFNYLIKSLN
jgi:5'(3')-deoxyribonucleotidase